MRPQAISPIHQRHVICRVTIGIRNWIVGFGNGFTVASDPPPSTEPNQQQAEESDHQVGRYGPWNDSGETIDESNHSRGHGRRQVSTQRHINEAHERRALSIEMAKEQQ